jgi:2-oxoglutarate ferredoxin oxidoreductase subunit alpha
MAPSGLATQEQPVTPDSRRRVVNDFTIQVATVNGSGSQTANLVLIRSIFQMGVPVSGKNMFPSNIAGLPTWYTIRANPDGYIGRKKEIDFLVAMNPETGREDVLTLLPDAAVVYDEPLKLKDLRSDLRFYPVPFDKLVAPVCPDAKLRRLVRSMIYDGILAKLLNIDMGEMENAVMKQLGRKAKAAQMNLAALKAGWDYAERNLPKQDRFYVERMDKTRGMILIEGNAAAALGCMMAGCTVVAWYPITPSSSLCETLITYMKKYRLDKDGKATFAIVQAEDEIAALGMVMGAGWAGARAMTSTAGPGISLMSEFTGLGYYAEVPAVIFDVQRVGPSTGLPTRTAQGDVLSTALLSHGDTKHPLLFPSSVGECYSMAMEAFDLAEQLQTPVFVMSDLDLGMNTWMSDPFPYPDKPINRGKMLTETSLRQMSAGWGRYVDVDGDGIPYRTIPGDGMPPYFARGSGHNAKGQYSERADDYGNNMDRLTRKFDTARTLAPQPEIEWNAQAKIGFIAYGTSHFSVGESRDQLRAERRIETSYYRVRAYPFAESLNEFFDNHDRVYVIEQNRDGQMAGLMRLELTAERIAKLRNVLHYNGLPIDARTITDGVLAQEGLQPPIAPELKHAMVGGAPIAGSGE